MLKSGLDGFDIYIEPKAGDVYFACGNCDSTYAEDPGETCPFCGSDDIWLGELGTYEISS